MKLIPRPEKIKSLTTIQNYASKKKKKKKKKHKILLIFRVTPWK